MKKFVFAALAMLFLLAVPAYAQVPDDTIDLPEQTIPEGAGDVQYQPPDTAVEMFSIEDGLENAGEHASEGAAVGGTGAYFGALNNENPAPAATSPLPSEVYVELPDTGGISLIAVAGAGVLIIGGGLLFLFTRSRG